MLLDYKLSYLFSIFFCKKMEAQNVIFFVIKKPKRVLEGVFEFGSHFQLNFFSFLLLTSDTLIIVAIVTWDTLKHSKLLSKKILS
jgi:hypothetical protein